VKTYADTKVIAPATNSADYVPQWDGVNSKTLKNGYVIGPGGIPLEVALTDYGATSTIVGWQASGRSVRIDVLKIGRMVFVSYLISGTSDSATTTFTVPYTSATGPTPIFMAYAVDNNGAATAAYGYATSNGVTIVLYKNLAAQAFTASGSKVAYGQFFYYAAA
jgi:hypothetical protein